MGKETLGQFYNDVCRNVDTEGTQINAAETKRVLACFFDCLYDRDSIDALRLVQLGLQQAEKRYCG